MNKIKYKVAKNIPLNTSLTSPGGLDNKKFEAIFTLSSIDVVIFQGRYKKAKKG